MTEENREVVVLPDLDAVSEEAARRFVTIVNDAVARSNRCTVALAGGSTPERLYRLLASATYRDAIPWAALFVFFGDERCVPPEDRESNYRMAREAMLDHVPVLPEQVFRMEGERDPQSAAMSYDATLGDVFGLTPGRIPHFDLILLGMGPDGHTASLFPQTDALQVIERLATANYVPKFDSWRLTLTYPVLDAAMHVLFLAGGAEKADAVQHVIEGPFDPAEFPSQGVRTPEGTVTFLLDAAAASKLTAPL
ncbi:MAG: 6-phosphogluconolactonase [Chloroflexota bacterium]|nr:6-phosphogluconolactonase [Chloroflexota bacterium]